MLPKATLVVFSHGKESGPHGSKIEALARIAESEGCQTLSIDYREHPAGTRHEHDAPGEPDRRVAQLRSMALPTHKRLVLVGSSMGGYVSTKAACHMNVHGLFLLAPAFFMPGYPQTAPTSSVRDTEIVHGWRDDVIAWEHSARWAAQSFCTLHLVDGDHRLNSSLKAIEPLFRTFIKKFAAEPER